jgi:PAS domain S-box-containing protein
MMNLDLRSFYFSFVLFLVVGLIVLVLLWLQTRKRLQGIEYFILCIFLTCIGDYLIFLRGSIPDFISIVVSNALIVFGSSMSYVGMEKFNLLKSSLSKHILIVIIFSIIHFYFYKIDPNLTIREINVSVAIGFISGLNAWLTLFKLRIKGITTVKVYGGLNAIFTIVSVYRIIFLSLHPEKNSDFFKTGFIDIGALAFLYGLFLLIFFFLILIINERLVNEIKVQEEKFSKAFQHAPFSMCITQMSDGRIMEINESFEYTIKSSKNFILGKTTQDLHIWLYESERKSFIQAVQEGSCNSKQYYFRKSNGETFLGEISAQSFRHLNDGYVISVIIDITDKKKEEEQLINSQQMLKRFASQLQNALEEEKIVLASKIDNELNQNLAALKIDLGVLKNELSDNNLSKLPGKFNKRIDTVSAIINDTLGLSVQLMNSLRNEVLYMMGLLDAMEIFIDEFSKTNKIDCRFHTNITRLTLPQKQSTPLFRVFENAMSNIAEHSKATSANIYLNANGKTLQLELVDNGIGFLYRDSMLFTSKGLMFMQERIHLLDGNMKVESTPGEGTKVTLEIPIAEKSYDIINNG